MTPAELRSDVVHPALVAVGLWSPSAEDLLIGTALQESGLRDIVQVGGGPALGYWQMEPATHDDIWTNYLLYRPGTADKVRAAAGEDAPHASLLLENPRYACVMARLKYLRSPESLPRHGDVAGYASMWKRVYNTAAGAGTEEEFIQNWNRHMGAGDVRSA